MTTLFVDKTGCDLDLEGGRIVLRQDGERGGTWPLALIERVVAHRGTRVSGRLVAALSTAGVGLMFDGGRSKDAPVTVAPAAADHALRLAQYGLMRDEAARAALATAIIAERIDGAIALVASIRPDDPRLSRLRAARGRLAAAPPPLQSLRGIEGSAAAAFFDLFADLVPKPFAFAGRNRRPPRDPVNACLSLGYTLVHFDATRAVALKGLDPGLGFYHDPAPGRASLASDIIEPQRPTVEGWVLDLLRSGGIGVGEFTMAGEACVLTKSARRFVYGHFEETVAASVRRALEARTDRFVATLRAYAAAARLGSPGDAAHVS